MKDIEGLPAWAQRRLARRLERGSSERIVRWMTIPSGRGVGPSPLAADGPESGETSGNVVAFVPRPEPAPFYERPRAAAAI